MLHFLEQILSRSTEWSTSLAAFYILNICVRQSLNLEFGNSCRGVYCSHTSNTAVAHFRGHYTGSFTLCVNDILFYQSSWKALHAMENQPPFMHFQHCFQMHSQRLCPPSPHRPQWPLQVPNWGALSLCRHSFNHLPCLCVPKMGGFRIQRELTSLHCGARTHQISCQLLLIH